MTDAFSDVADTDNPTEQSHSADESADDGVNGDGDGDSDEDATVQTTRQTDADEEPVTAVTAQTRVPAQFADEVRSTLDRADDFDSPRRYTSEDDEQAADDVDARALFRAPTIDELRYYAREGPYGPTIVEKPIEDAFKHGLNVVGDNTDPNTSGPGTIESFLDQYQPVYKRAKKKARRDGLAIVLFQYADSNPIQRAPADDATFEGFQVYTLDNFSGVLADSTVAEHTEYETDQIYVSNGPEHGGVAIVDDLSSPDHGDVVGYGVEPRQDSEDVQDVVFVNAMRCQHLTEYSWVDGHLGNNVTGKHVGESVLTPVLQPLKAAQMGFWSLMQILHRYSAPLHAVEPPESWGEDEWNTAQSQLEDLSMASDAILPPGTELEVAEGVSEFDPVPLYEVLVESICAGTVFTKSVLQGTQTGTVSGSETDMKGYFSNVHVLRTDEIESEFRDALRMVSRHDQSVVPRVADVDGVSFEWGPLFKPTDIERAEGAVSLVTAATNAIKNYALTPDEARSVLSEEWAEFDIDVDLDELTEEQMDTFDRINVREVGRGPKDDEPRQNPTLQNGGGQPAGQGRASSQPTRAGDDTDSTDGAITLDEDTVNVIVDRVADRLDDNTGEES